MFKIYIVFLKVNIFVNSLAQLKKIWYNAIKEKLMSSSLLLNWFEDWGRAIKDGLGYTGVVIFMVAFFTMSVCLFYGIVRRLTITTKLKVAWGYIFFLIIFILFFVWFATIL